MQALPKRRFNLAEFAQSKRSISREAVKVKRLNNVDSK